MRMATRSNKVNRQPDYYIHDIFVVFMTYLLTYMQRDSRIKSTLMSIGLRVDVPPPTIIY